MARARKQPEPPAEPAAEGSGSAGEANTFGDMQQPGGLGGKASDSVDNENRSEQTLVVLPVEDEPARRYGGWILTDNGWVVEGDPVHGEDAEHDSAEQEE